MSTTTLSLFVFVVSAAMACGRKPRPWQARPDGGVIDESQPFLPVEPDAGAWLGGDAGGWGTGGADPAGRPERPTNRAGGLWVGCAQGFRPGDDPKKDAHRLGLLCGPGNGMRRVKGFEGRATEAPVRHALPVRAGSCYRVVGAADPGVTDLDVVISSVRGTRLASDDADDRLIMVERDRPFCTFADEELTLEVRAEGGSGRYALEIYQLPANP